MADIPFVDYLKDQFARADIPSVRLVGASSDKNVFGNAEATLSVDPIYVRVVRDRGQEFLDLAMKMEPEKFYQFGDVEIAMGWATISEVLSRKRVETLEEVLVRFKKNLKQLKEAFSGDQERFTRVRILKAEQERGEAFVTQLRKK